MPVTAIVEKRSYFTMTDEEIMAVCLRLAKKAGLAVPGSWSVGRKKEWASGTAWKLIHDEIGTNANVSYTFQGSKFTFVGKVHSMYGVLDF